MDDMKSLACICCPFRLARPGRRGPARMAVSRGVCFACRTFLREIIDEIPESEQVRIGLLLPVKSTPRKWWGKG